MPTLTRACRRVRVHPLVHSLVFRAGWLDGWMGFGMDAGRAQQLPGCPGSSTFTHRLLQAADPVTKLRRRHHRRYSLLVGIIAVRTLYRVVHGRPAGPISIMHAIAHPKHAALRLHPVALPSTTGSILLAHVSHGTCGKSLLLDPSYQTRQLPTYTRLRCPVILLLCLCHSGELQEAQARPHIIDPAAQTPEYHAAQEQGPTQRSLGAREVVRRPGSAATEPTTTP